MHLKRIAAAAAVWVMVGVPVAAAIAAFRVFVYVLVSLPEMVCIAAVLGAAQGAWLSLGAPPAKHVRPIAAVSGGVLGVLGFPPLVSRLNVIVDRPTVAVFFLAAVIGGIAAGLAASRIIAAPLRASLARTIFLGGVVFVALVVVDYRFYWPATIDRLPVPIVSHQAIANLSAGTASGSTWSGCYQYLGQTSRGSGVIGKDGGLLTVAEADGALKVFDGGAQASMGGVDSNGRFRFGTERTTGDTTLRDLWEGDFNSEGFTRRMSVSRGNEVINTTRLTGTVRRVSCGR
jgi:hypothetical protein